MSHQSEINSKKDWKKKKVSIESAKNIQYQDIKKKKFTHKKIKINAVKINEIKIQKIIYPKPQYSMEKGSNGNYHTQKNQKKNFRLSRPKKNQLLQNKDENKNYFNNSKFQRIFNQNIKSTDKHFQTHYNYFTPPVLFKNHHNCFGPSNRMTASLSIFSPFLNQVYHPWKYKNHYSSNANPMLLKKRNSSQMFDSTNLPAYLREDNQRLSHMYQNVEASRFRDPFFFSVNQSNPQYFMEPFYTSKFIKPGFANENDQKASRRNDLIDHNAIQFIRKLDDSEKSDHQFRNKLKDLCMELVEHSKKEFLK